MKSVKSIRIVTDDTGRTWDTFAGHPLQSWAWGQFRSRMGIELIRLGFYEAGTLTGGLQATVHTIPHTPWAVGYAPKGPLPVQEHIDALGTIGRQKSLLFMQLEPDAVGSADIPSAIRHGTAISNTDHMHFLMTRNPLFRRSHHPLFTKYTFILDLTKSEDMLLAAMHHKTRYNIKIARRAGVLIKEDPSDEAFSQYLRLTAETTERQAFYAHTSRYHKIMWETMRDAGIAHLFTATLGEDTVAAWILFRWKDTLYYPYGASSRKYRETMAPTLMLWETALWGKNQGLSKYDLWGALGPQADTNDPWFGFHRFKAGFGPDLIEYTGSFDLVIRPSLYRAYTIADRLRWLWLKAKKTGK